MISTKESRAELRERLLAVRDASWAKRQHVYDVLFDGAYCVYADYWVRKHTKDDPFEWGIYPRQSQVFATSGWNQRVLLRYPDGTWHWHDSGASTEDGRWPAVDDDVHDPTPVSALVDDLLSGDPEIFLQGGAEDTGLNGWLQGFWP